MPEETTNGSESQENNQQSESGYNPSSLDEAMKIINALEKRVGERDTQIDSLKSTTQTLSEQMQTLQAAQKKRLEQSGNYEELARQRAAEVEALSPYKERASALESVIRDANEQLIEQIPESMRGVVPKDYPPEKLNQWLTSNQSLLSKTPAPDYDAGASGASPRQAKLTPEQKRIAAQFGLTEDEYLSQLDNS